MSENNTPELIETRDPDPGSRHASPKHAKTTVLGIALKPGAQIHFNQQRDASPNTDGPINGSRFELPAQVLQGSSRATLKEQHCYFCVGASVAE